VALACRELPTAVGKLQHLLRTFRRSKKTVRCSLHSSACLSRRSDRYERDAQDKFVEVIAKAVFVQLDMFSNRRLRRRWHVVTTETVREKSSVC